MKRATIVVLLAAVFTSCTDGGDPPTGPTTGSITVTVSTAGDDAPTGYTAVLDGGTNRSVDVSGSVTFTSLLAGSHSVELTDVPTNCTVTSANPASVTVTAGGSAPVPMTVECSALEGEIEVTVNSTGADTPVAYIAVVDGGASQSVNANGSVKFPGLPLGSHSVELTNEPANCTVTSSNPAVASVTAGGTTPVIMVVECSALVDPDAKRIVVSVVVTPSMGTPGDSIIVAVSAVPTDVQVETIELAGTGLLEVSETRGVSTAGRVDLSFVYFLPLDPAEGTVTFRATAAGEGISGTDETTLDVRDTEPPQIVFLNSMPADVVVPGGELFFRIGVNDNAGTSTVVWSWEGAVAGRDSTWFAPDREIGLSQWFQVPEDAVPGDSVIMTVRAVDIGGNSATAERTVPVGGRHIPIDVLEFGGEVNDVAYDPARERLYVSLPGLNRVAVVSLSDVPSTIVTEWILPGQPHGMDLTPDGLELVVALADMQHLAFIDLATGAIDTVRLDLPVSPTTLLPDNLRILNNDKAIVTLSHSDIGLGGQIWDYDLATGAHSQRSEVGFLDGQVTESVKLARSEDRASMLLFHENNCCPAKAHVYDSSTDSFGPRVETVYRWYTSVSADAAGNRYLIGSELFDGNLNLLGAISPPPDTGPYYTPSVGDPTVIALGAASVFMATDYGFAEIAVSGGTVLRWAVLPARPENMWIGPDGARMIVTWDSSLGIVDLVP